MQRLLLYIFGTLFLWACESPKDLSIEEILTPVEEGGEPNLFAAENGDLYLSWVAYINDSTDALNYTRLVGDEWSKPQEIARGIDWFVNWADFPSIAAFEGKSDALVAHWLQKSAGGTYDYDVQVSLSKDAGANWSPSFIPHTDGIPAEHGFVTLLPAAKGRMFVTWLDGRNTKDAPVSNGADHGHGGAMTLRTAEFDLDGQLFEEAELDHRICDCCQTDAVMTANGPIVVYRDRSTEEVRDIYIVRKVNGNWTQPQPVASDSWKIAGCPVNGPAAAAKNNLLAVAWFTGADQENHVKVALSSDAGASFTEGFIVDDGQPIGRVDVVLNRNGEAVVSWIEEVERGGEIRLATVNVNGKQGESKTLMTTGISRQSGFPILEKHQDSYILAWTSGEEKTTVRTIRFEL